MEPGHPYLTKQLDEKRAEHRRLREVIRASDEGSIYSDSTASVDNLPQDATRAEHHTRLIIDQFLAPHRDWLTVEELNQAAIATTRLSHEIEGDQWIEAAKYNIGSNASTYRTQHAQLDDHADKDRRRALRDVLVMMDVADLLAERG
jgi:hypothetical protein